MNNRWTIATLDQAPAMTCSFHDVVGTYLEAVAATQESYRATGRSTTLRSGGHHTGSGWHHVSSGGVATDRNTNSGVPARSVL
jgi:hypothetical protein